MSGEDEEEEEEQDEEEEEAEDDDEEEAEDDEEEEAEDDEEGETEVWVDLNVSPVGTWEKARTLKKVNWIKSPKWKAYMKEVLGGMAEKDWTMKRFLANLCVMKKISGYTKNLPAKKIAQLLDQGRISAETSPTTVHAKVTQAHTHSSTHTHTHTHTQNF